MPKLAEVGPAKTILLVGESAQEEERELPASNRARGKVHAVESPSQEETDA